MKKILIILAIGFLIAIFMFIKNQKKENLIFSFYHWENSFKEKEINDKLYIKVLDINYSNKLEVIKTNFIEKAPENYIPIIFITNKTFLKEDSKIVLEEILKYLENLEFDEVQIDCDWSDSTKNNYFLFLKELKNRTNKKLSTTIRLHQIKYFKKTGVPPVDYGVLMYYNMSNLADFNTKNYVLDNIEAKKYHYNFKNYPLKLKLALPLYSQAVQFRDKKAVNLFENIKEYDFKENFEKLENNLYKVTKSHYFKGKYIYKDDIFRFEDSSESELKIALNDFFKLSNNSFNEVIFYTIKYKTKYNLQNLLNN